MKTTFLKKINFSLPGQSTLGSTYGSHQVYKKFILPEKALPVNSNIPLSDQGMVLSIIAKYSLPFSSARNISEVAKEMMRDPKATNKLQVARRAKSYKKLHGLAKGMERQLIDKLREGFFSFNIDEATSSNLHKVLTLLVSYFCTTKNEVVVEHLGSSETAFKAVIDLVNEKELPWCNLMAVLMDSCSVMRGSKNGFEISLHEIVTPALIDMDGDSCHHIHNA